MNGWMDKHIQLLHAYTRCNCIETCTVVRCLLKGPLYEAVVVVLLPMKELSGIVDIYVTAVNRLLVFIHAMKCVYLKIP